MFDDRPNDKGAHTRLSERDARLLGKLRARAAPQFQRIAAEFVAMLRGENEKLVVLGDVRDRLSIKKALTDWAEKILSGGEGTNGDAERASWPPNHALSALLLIQSELGRLADQELGSDAEEARRALMRALCIEAELLVAGVERSARGRMPSIPPELPNDSERSAVRSLAHDIRNPLNGAMLHATFLERELEDLQAGPDLIEAVTTIKAEVRRVAEMLDEFVDAKARSAGARARVPVSALCNQAIGLVARDAAAAGIEVGADIAAEFGSSDVLLEVDVSKMLEVLSQLLQQALEAALAGGGKVLLRARRESESAIIEVRHDQRALTTPVPILGSLLPSGSQGENAHSDFGNLNVAIKVVAEHGGTIEVDSQPGRTEFRVKLPIGAVQQRVSEHY